MKIEILQIIEKIQSKELDKYDATEHLLLLIDYKGCINPYILFENPIGHWCANCNHNEYCKIFNKND